MKPVWVVIGFISLGLGIVGIFLPVLPTTPFLLLTTYCFTKGSEKFHNWFISTAIYKKYLENYVSEKAMTIKQKVKLLVSVFVVMSIGFYFMKSVPMKIVLAVIYLAHLVYFGFMVKTKK